MSTPLVSYDHADMHAKTVGAHGIPAREFAALVKRLGKVRAVLARQAKRRQGFMSIPYRAAELREARALARAMRKRFHTLLVIGIGGSDLGARALDMGLRDPHVEPEVRFLGANTDPDEIMEALHEIDLAKTCVNVISKSGETIEPMSTFLLVREALIRKVGAKRHARHVVATTGREANTLRALAEREGYATLPVPEDIGGRFSALTAVGLFPLAFAGVDVDSLLRGAKRVLDHSLAAPAAKSGPLLYAGLHHAAATRRGQNVAVLMPYAHALRGLAPWWAQLWGESLGKKHDRRGRVVHAGQTPYAALGATDQHSQLQLWNEGPADKVLTFVRVERFKDDVALPDPHPDIEGLSYMAGIRMSRVIRTELEATAAALAASGRPSGVLSIARVDALHLGGLMMFFMLAVAAAGELYDIDAYDQPGVQSMKTEMFRRLGRSA